MDRTRKIAWWLGPSILVVLFDAWMGIHELIGGSLLGDVDPRAEVMVAGLASCAGALYHLARVGARVDRVRA